MKLEQTLKNILTNKIVLNVVLLIALLNVIGYIVIGKTNSVLVFIILAILIRFFSKNMIIILGIPLILVNLLNINKGIYSIEGLENNKNVSTSKKPENDKKITTENTDVVSSNVKDEKNGFEVGRKKNGSKIDYATTIEDAYDQLNQILGSDGIKNLTNDTQKLMSQQMELAKSMEAMTPLIKNIMPMAQQAQEMMKNMDSGTGGLGSVMELAKKMSNNLTLQKT